VTHSHRQDAPLARHCCGAAWERYFKSSESSRAAFVLSSHLSLVLSNGHFPSKCHTKPHMHYSTPICAPCPSSHTSLTTRIVLLRTNHEDFPYTTFPSSFYFLLLLSTLSSTPSAVPCSFM
jgi:hypothetical protein